MRLIKHIRRWNHWRKHNLNSPLYHILVLFGIVKSPTMCLVLLPEEKTDTAERIIEWTKTVGDDHVEND